MPCSAKKGDLLLHFRFGFGFGRFGSRAIQVIWFPFIVTNNYFGQTGRGKTASSSSSSGSALQVWVWVWYSGSLFYYLDSLNKAPTHDLDQ